MVKKALKEHRGDNGRDLVAFVIAVLACLTILLFFPATGPSVLLPFAGGVAALYGLWKVGPSKRTK